MPEHWASGYYMAQLILTSGPQRGKGNQVPFVVRTPAQPAAIVLVTPVNTVQAYNNWGGKSLYNSNSTDRSRANRVSSTVRLP